jgi:Tfp pilus assembly protein PilO
LTYRRQKQQYLFAIGLGAIAVINVLFFLILHRPARNDYFALQESIELMHRDIKAREHSVDRLEKLGAQLETYGQDRQKMYTSHFLQRDTGFARILPELETIAQRIGVRKSRVDYTISSESQYGLYSVKIQIPVEGSYSSIVKFIQELESSEIFFIIESISLRAASQTGAGSVVALSMALETFFYQ